MITIKIEEKNFWIKKHSLCRNRVREYKKERDRKARGRHEWRCPTILSPIQCLVYHIYLYLSRYTMNKSLVLKTVLYKKAIVTSFIENEGQKKEAPQLINANRLDATFKTGSADASLT